MDQTPFYKAIMYWHENAIEALLKMRSEEQQRLEENKGQQPVGKTTEEKQYEYAIENVNCLKKALPLMQQQWHRDNGPLTAPINS